MQPTDQPVDIQAVDSPYLSAAELARSVVDSSSEDMTAPVHHRSVCIQDDRFLSGWIHVVAWDVVCQGSTDLSTMLCRSASGDYFLRSRSGDQPDVEASLVPLSEAEAALWFDQHPIHFAPRDVRWQ